MNHQAMSNTPTASEIIDPQLGVPGSMPMPRNDRAASKRMTCGIRIVP